VGNDSNRQDHNYQSSYCASDLDLADIIDAADNTLFQQVLTNRGHVLATLLFDKVDLHYRLRLRHQHCRQLIPKINKMVYVVSNKSVLVVSNV